MPSLLSPLLIELEFARAEQAGDPFAFRFDSLSYLLRSVGGGFENVRLSWDEGLLAELQAVRRPGRDPALLQRLGELLRQFLAPAGWSKHEEHLLAAVQQGRRVLLSIRSAAAELYALPWELLTLKATGQHLGELPEVLLRYEWPETSTTPAQPDPRPEGGRVLLAWSASGGAVPVAEHLAAIRSACQAGFQDFDPERDVLADASVSRLGQVLESARSQGPPIAVLHLLCHGSAAGSTFGLALTADRFGEPAAVVDAGQLRQLLAPYASMLRLVVLAACDSGNGGALGNQLGSVAQTLHRAGIQAVMASRHPLSAQGSVLLTEALYHELLAESAALESALLRARSRLAHEPSRLDWASLQLYARASDGEDTRPLVLRPYRGLLAFQPEHQRFFFGRQDEIDKVLAGLRALAAAGRPRMMVVAGASGTGKSSLVLAGIIPRLRAATGGAWQVLRMRPGSEPLDALQTALAQRGAADGPVLLFVDQLEELFTQTMDATARQAAARRLWQLAGAPDSTVSVLLTLRVDFLGRCAELALDESGLRLDALAYDDAHHVFLPQLGAAQLRVLIDEPARRVGLHLEDGLTSRMVQELDGEPGALPLLQDTLDLLWQRRSGSALTQSAYAEVGGVTGALQGRADALIDRLDAAEQRTARRLLVQLVSTAEGAALATRRRVPIDKLRPAESAGDAESARFHRVLELLAGARLLVRDGHGKEQFVEVAHEALIRKWGQLAAWVQADRGMRAELEKVETWVAQCEELKTLLQQNQITYVEAVQKRYPDELSARARELLSASQARAEAERAARRAQDWSVAARQRGIFFALAGTLGLLLWRLWVHYGGQSAAFSAHPLQTEAVLSGVALAAMSLLTWLFCRRRSVTEVTRSTMWMVLCGLGASFANRCLSLLSVDTKAAVLSTDLLLAATTTAMAAFLLARRAWSIVVAIFLGGALLVRLFPSQPGLACALCAALAVLAGALITARAR